jgi:parallel beta-helix repeat protein
LATRVQRFGLRLPASKAPQGSSPWLRAKSLELEQPTSAALFLMSAKYQRRLGTLAFLLVMGFLGWVMADSYLLSVRQDNNRAMVLGWNSVSGNVYQVFWSSNLAGGTDHWQFLGQTTATGQTLTVIDAGGLGRPHPSNSLSRFYRAQTVTASTNSAPTPITSDITVNTVWGLTSSPLLINSDIHVHPGIQLTIQPGVRVLFTGYGKLTVDGCLQVQGAPGQPVVFTSGQAVPKRGDWVGLAFTASSSNCVSVLANALVEYAQIGVNCTDCSPQLLASTIRLCSQQGVYLTRSSPLIQGCSILQNSSYGIYCYDSGSPQILNNQIVQNGSYGVSINGTSAAGHNSLALLRGNTLDRNSGYAVLTSGFYLPGQVIVDARSNWWGTVDATAIANLVYDYTDNPNGSPVVNFGNWLLSPNGPAVGGTYVSGPISGNTVWRTSDSPIGVIGNLQVISNASLTIQPGVEVDFYGRYGIQVDGGFQAQGTAASPILLTSSEVYPLPGDWVGLTFTASSSNSVCVLSNTVVEFAQAGIRSADCSPTLWNTTIQDCSQQGIYLTRSSPLVQGCTIQANGSYGIYASDTSSPLILQSQIIDNGSYGIYLYGTGTSGHNCLAVIQGNTLLGNASYALEAYNYFQASQVTIDARTNWWGTADPSAIAAMIYDYSDNTTWSPVVNFGNWLGSAGGQPAPGRAVSGPILANTTWQLTDSPVAVVGNLLVTSNATLTIQPGVQVLFYGNCMLQVDGGLSVLGTSHQPVIFSSGKAVPQPGDWQGLVFTAGSSNDTCVVSNAVIQYAQVGVRCTDTSPAIANSAVQYCSQQGIYLTRSSPGIMDCTVQRNGSYGVYCQDASSPQIQGAHVVANGSYGIYLYGTGAAGHNCLPVIQGSTLVGNVSYAVAAQNYYQPALAIVDARGNWWGTADATAIASMVYDYADNPGSSAVVNYGNWLGAQDGSPVGGRFVHGQLAGNIVWQTDDSPIGIIGPVLVSSNATLTIQPGVEVAFYGNFALQVDGSLQALGTASQPILFTSADPFPLPGDWQGLIFTASSSNSVCVVSNSVFEYAQVGIRATDTSFRLAGSTVQYCSQQGIYLTRSSPALLGCTVQQNASYGIYCTDNSSPQVLGSQVIGNASYGIFLYGTGAGGHNCLPVIQGNSILGNGSYAVVAQNYYRPALTIIDARSNWWGTADAPTIVALIYDYANSTTYSPVVNFANWLNGPGGTATPGSCVAGQLGGSSVWGPNDSPVGLIGPLLVASNASLTIQPGVQVLAYGNFLAQVDGTLQALGQSTNPVVFSSGKAAPSRGDWGGLQFNPGSSNNPCVLSNVVISYAQEGVTCSSASPAIVSSTIQFCSGQGINLTRSSPLIQGCVVQQNNSYGIYCYDASSPLIQGNQVLSNSSYGLYLYGTAASGHNSQPVITGNTLLGNGGYALFSYNYYQPNQTTVDARSNWWGTTDPIAIANLVYDYTDNPNSSPVVNYGNWFLSQTGPAVAGRFVSGQILGNNVWQTGDSPIGVIAPLQVVSNASLTIQPGVQVLFYGNYLLQVDGSLQAVGLPASRVVFTSGRTIPQKSDWSGLKFTALSTNNSCVLSNVLVEFADIAVNAVQSSPLVTASQLRQNRLGVYLDTAASQIANNLVELNDTGISCYQYSSPMIISNTIVRNRYNGVEVTSSTTSQDRNPHPLLLGNSIFTNAIAGGGYYNLYTYNFYHPSANTIPAVSNWWGTADINLVRQSIYYYSNNPSYSPFVSYTPLLASNLNYTAYGATNSGLWFSPNADGVLGTMPMFASLTATSAWSVAVVDQGGTVTRTLLGSGPAVSVIWDGTNQLGNPAAEGRYRTIVTSTNLSDGRVSIVYGGLSILDRTFPTGAISVNTLADGMVANQMVLTGTAIDNSFYGYAVDYGAGTSPGSFTLLNSNGLPVSAGVLGQLDSRSVSNGVYTFRLRVYDYAGNITTTQVVLTVDNVLIINPDAPTPFFDPAQGPNSVLFGLNKNADAKVTISPVTVTADAAGNLSVNMNTMPIRSFAQHLPAGPVNISWDGRDSFGNSVSNGSYAFRVYVQSDLGRTNWYDPPYIAGPVTFNNNSVSTNNNFQANDPVAISYNLYAPAYVGIGLASPVGGNIVAGVAQDAGPHTVYWNGRLASTHQIIYGSFQINLLTQVLPENALVANHVVPTVIGSLKTESYVITPAYAEVSVIYYTLLRPATVTLWLLDPNGNRISLFQQNAQPAGSYNYEWNGYFDAVSIAAISGDYEVHLDTVDSVTGDLQSVISNLTVRR